LKISFHGQATKGVRWMPWRWKTMKDVASCDKPRGAAEQALIRGFLNEATRLARKGSFNNQSSLTEYIGEQM
jgi:hypothetical protein